MSSPAAIVEMLKKCPRGQLSYERQSSITNRKISVSQSEKSSTSHVLETSLKDSTTLAGSLADVSSVLEDVTNEMSDIQAKRLAAVIEKIKANKEKNNQANIKLKEREDEKTFVWVSPLINDESDEEIQKKSPPTIRKKIDFTTSSAPNDMMTLITIEMAKLESERMKQVEAKVEERRKRLSIEHQEQKRKSLVRFEQSLKNIQNQISLQAAKEKEAEDNHIIHQAQLNDTLKNQIAERQAQVELHLQKAKQMEAAKLEKKRKFMEQNVSLVANLSLTFHHMLAFIEQPEIDETLKTFGMDAQTFPGFLENAKNDAKEPEKAMAILVSISNSFAQLIEDHQQKLVKAEEEAKIKAAQEEEAKIKDEQERKRLEEQTRLSQVQPASAPAPPAALQKPPPSSPPDCKEISDQNAAIFQNHIDFRNTYVANLKQMTINKEFKFACQKAVTTPLNAISDVSAEHLKDKLLKLTALLDGQQVQASENTRFQASNQAELCYAKNLLAKKFISHGEEVVGSKPKNAFIAASMVVALWSKHADFGKILMANLFEACPYLIPKNHQRSKEASDAEYFKNLGYYINDGIIEDKTMFLKRMSGLTRMYAAITVSRLPGNDSTSIDHPHGLGHLWKLLASTLNLHPLNDITASVLYDLLSVGGAFLLEKYGATFFKLLQCLASAYFPKIQQVTEEGCGGPVARLELFLQKAIQSNSIDKPEGLLRADFL